MAKIKINFSSDLLRSSTPYLFTILLKKDIIVTPVEKRLQRVENYIQMLKIQMKLL